MTPAPKGRYPPAEHYRLNNEDQLVTKIPRSAQRTLALLSFLSTLYSENLAIGNPHPPDQEDHATTGEGLPAPRQMTTLLAEVAGAFRELR